MKLLLKLLVLLLALIFAKAENVHTSVQATDRINDVTYYARLGYYLYNGVIRGLYKDHYRYIVN